MDRVLEIGGFAAGYSGRLFAHAGADVVRVELGEQLPGWASEDALDLFLHAGKRCVTLTDHTIIAELASKADVVICEARTADDLLAMGFDAWSAPVKVAITPFGRTGPKRNWQGPANVILAMGGYTQLMGDADRAPLSLPGHYVEFQTGSLAYTAANACRLAGLSKAVDVGMLETLMSLSQFTSVRWHCTGELRSRHGSDFWFVVPSNLFACVDGWIYLNIVPSFWDPLTVFLDQPELLVDDRFATNDLRMQNRDVLHELTAKVISTMTKQQLVSRAQECRIPLGVVQTFEEVLADEHLADRDFWQAVGLDADASLNSPGLAYRMSYKSSTNGSGGAPKTIRQVPW